MCLQYDSRQGGASECVCLPPEQQGQQASSFIIVTVVSQECAPVVSCYGDKKLFIHKVVIKHFLNFSNELNVEI